MTISTASTVEGERVAYGNALLSANRVKAYFGVSGSQKRVDDSTKERLIN